MKKNLFVCLLALSVAFVSCNKSDSKEEPKSVMTATQFSEYVSKVTLDNKEVVEGEIEAAFASVKDVFGLYTYLSSPLPNITSEGGTYDVQMMLADLNESEISVLELIGAGLTNELIPGDWYIDLYEGEGTFNLPQSADSTLTHVSFALKVNADSCYRFEFESMDNIEIPLGVDSMGVESFVEFPTALNFEIALESGNAKYPVVSFDFATALYQDKKEVVGEFIATLGKSRTLTGGFEVTDTKAEVFGSYITNSVKLTSFEATMPCKNFVSYLFDNTIEISAGPMTIKFGFANDALVYNYENLVFDKQMVGNFNFEEILPILADIMLESSNPEWKGIKIDEFYTVFGVSSNQQVVEIINALLQNFSISIPEDKNYTNPVARIQVADEDGYAVLYYVCGDGSKVAVSQVPMFGYDTIYQCIAAVVTKAMMAIMPILGGGIF